MILPKQTEKLEFLMAAGSASAEGCVSKQTMCQIIRDESQYALL